MSPALFSLVHNGMRIGIQKTLVDSGSFASGSLPAGPAFLTSSIVDCSDWNSATMFVSYSAPDPACQLETRTFINSRPNGPFFRVTGSGQQEFSQIGLSDNFTFSVDLAGARQFYLEFEEVGDPTQPDKPS